MWQAPVYTTGLGLVMTGTYPLSYTLPTELRTGQYTFLLQVDGREYAYPIDVRGWKVTTRHVWLDKARYDRQDQLTATAEFWNESGTPITGLRLTSYIFTPDDGEVLNLTPPVSRTIDLQSGLNVITVTGTFSTPVVGPHRLLINVGRPTWRVAGASAQFDVGSAHIVDLTTDQGDYAPDAPGVGQLDVYGFGPTQLVVTATNGSTLLDVQPNLSGFGTLTFTIPTTPTGDYLLVAHSIDQFGAIDQRIRAYAVPGPRDTQAPQLQLTYPNTDTLITSGVQTTTLIVTGQATDNSGAVTVLVNGIVVTPTASGAFSLPIELTQGTNLISASAVDAAGNTTFTPIFPVMVVPPRGFSFTADQNVVDLRQAMMFRTVLTATAALSDVGFLQLLPTTWVTDVAVSASSGVANVGGLDPTLHTVMWHGDLIGGQPVTITVQAIPLQTGTLTQTANIYWGWGLIDESEPVTVPVNLTQPPRRFLYLPLVTRESP